MHTTTIPSTTLHSPQSSTETLHPPSTRPPESPEPPRRPRPSRRARRESWLTRLTARWRRQRFDIDPYTARQNEFARIEREAAQMRARAVYGGFR
ncbi:hypothetical protein [Microbacterium sp. MPKO10]|uniref:hypothetical protein n=1 Tax=Microbacterium sp. MPKO10 TaxID=2989818 RepID=UPI002236634D|nr:hypothetical protein [Microbacterium sp. MPKO10]MCW4456855.1 hypothetical protein [Microbacterium sp. MPKO10]